MLRQKVLFCVMERISISVITIIITIIIIITLFITFMQGIYNYIGYLKQIMFLGHMVLQLYGIYNLCYM
jgi:hypothetical protein